MSSQINYTKGNQQREREEKNWVVFRRKGNKEMSTRVVHIFAIKYAVAFSAIRLPVHKTWWNGSLGNASPSVDYEMRDWRKYFNMYGSSSGEWARERDRRSKSTKAAKGKGRERKSVPMSACIRIQIHNMLMQQHGDALCTYIHEICWVANITSVQQEIPWRIS